MDIHIKTIKALIEDEPNTLANMCNITAYLNSILEDINWIGFYLYENNELVLGPFQGNVACTHIQLGSGVCGHAAINRKTYRVDNVHEFEGHIACDSASNSEIVIPIIKDDQLIGVLDIDSPSLNRFSEEDQLFLEAFVETIKMIF